MCYHSLWFYIKGFVCYNCFMDSLRINFHSWKINDFTVPVLARIVSWIWDYFPGTRLLIFARDLATHCPYLVTLSHRKDGWHRGPWLQFQVLSVWIIVVRKYSESIGGYDGTCVSWQLFRLGVLSVSSLLRVISLAHNVGNACYNTAPNELSTLHSAVFNANC